MPKASDAEKAARHQAMQDATKYAVEVPLKVAQTCVNSMEVMVAMADIGNPNSVTDAGVGALCARTGALGAIMNAKINLGDIEDQAWKAEILSQCAKLEEEAEATERKVRDIVESKMG